MNYELCKQLKDAGFKQSGKGNTICVSFSLHNIYVPTLSELIEACGDGFGGLQKEDGYFNAYSKSDLNKKVLKIYSTGLTTEEAVAHLWLALNK